MQFDFPKVEDEASRARIETAISAFVRAFYAKGGADPLLGPVFADSIADLDRHIEIVANFWSRSLLQTDRYEGHPFPVHINSADRARAFQTLAGIVHGGGARNLARNPGEPGDRQGHHVAQCFQSGLFPFTGADGQPSRTPAS